VGVARVGRVGGVSGGGGGGGGGALCFTLGTESDNLHCCPVSY
jgi:hypothetical protein